MEGWDKVPRPLQFSKMLQIYNNQLFQDSSVSFFEKVNNGDKKWQVTTIKNLKITLKLELVSSL